MSTGIAKGSNATLATPLRDRLAYKIDLRIPHFTRTVPPGAVLQYSLVDRPTEPWYREFFERIMGSIGNRHFPVFRFGDGECVFSVGYRFTPRPPDVPAVRHYAKTLLSAYVKHRLHRNFRSGSGKYGYELYNYAEWQSARPRFVEYLKEIAAEGVIGFNFVIQFGKPFCDRYIPPVCDWLDRNGLVITEDNFLPCYFVYGVLIGPDRRRLLQGRRILAVTSLDEGKERALREGLAREGVKSVQLIRISRSKSMLDRIDLGRVERPVDVALVGAGVGASNILHQLRPLGTLCIDAGYALDCIAEPDRKGSRVFTLPDEEVFPASRPDPS